MAGKTLRVPGAGIVEVRAGKIYPVDNASGNFKPGEGSLEAAKSIFSKIPRKHFKQGISGI